MHIVGGSGLFGEIDRSCITPLQIWNRTAQERQPWGLPAVDFDISEVKLCDEKKERSRRNAGFYTHHVSSHESTDHAQGELVSSQQSRSPSLYPNPGCASVTWTTCSTATSPRAHHLLVGIAALIASFNHPGNSSASDLSPLSLF